MASGTVSVLGTILILHFFCTTQANNDCTSDLCNRSRQLEVSLCVDVLCGINAQCTVIGGRPVCSCRPGYVKNRLNVCVLAQCSVNSDCRLDQKCVNQLCTSSCTSSCGINAACSFINHLPVCVCPPGTTGDPFVNCATVTQPECLTDMDCGSQYACIQQKCQTPCTTTCGKNTECTIVNHNPICTCLAGYTGDPFVSCYLV